MNAVSAEFFRRGPSIFLVAGSIALAACNSTSNPRVSGTQGGLLPGMERPAAAPNGNAPAPSSALPEITSENLPDGRVVQTNTVGGVVYSKVWFSPQGVPEQMIFFENGVVPVAREEYDKNGVRARVTQWFPGTTQPQRVEEYAGGNTVTRFATFWPNGNRKVLSEAAVATEGGTVNRIQQWYENGRPKSLVQRLVLPNGGFMQQGRQTNWDETGFLVYDVEFDHNVLVRDYLTKRAAPW